MAAVNAMAGRHYTVLISLDGFRWDYPLMYDTPFLGLAGARGRKRGDAPVVPLEDVPPTTIRWPRASCPTTTA